MAVRSVLEYPDPRLRQHAAPVAVFDDRLKGVVTDLYDTLYASEAIGLCAPQIDEPMQVLVMDLSGNASAPQTFINPEIIAEARPGLVEESCLSLPGAVARVFRATQVRVRACDTDGAEFETDLQDMHAVCLQHEMDHFEGKLLVDRVSFLQRWFIRAKARRRAG